MKRSLYYRFDEMVVELPDFGELRTLALRAFTTNDQGTLIEIQGGPDITVAHELSGSTMCLAQDINRIRDRIRYTAVHRLAEKLLGLFRDPLDAASRGGKP